MVRPAAAADASRVAEILVFAKRAAYREVFHDDRGSFAQMQVGPLIDAYRADPRLLDGFWVYDDGVVKGVMSRRDGERAGERELCELYVEPAFKGQGVGGALMERLIAEARELGRARLTLWVIEQNASARRFYERFGFAPSGERRLVEGTDVPELRYQRAL